MTEDGHSPQTCNWRECNAESDVPCPFKADERPIIETPVDAGCFPENLSLPKKHKHKYTIPVEWTYSWIALDQSATVRYTNGKQVTKLRCECGDEIARP